MYQTLELAKRLGVIVTAHCENAELVARLQQKLLAEGKTGPEWHEPSRPESVEAEGTGRFATFLENTGATGYVVHLSCEKALRAALDAKARGVKIHVESVLPHFLLDKTYAERPGVEGMKHVMSPPLRAKHNQDALWNALAVGSIDTVGTDHCPFDTEQKLLGKDSFVNIPNGIPGIEDRVNLLYTLRRETRKAGAWIALWMRRVHGLRSFSDCSRAKAQSQWAAMRTWWFLIRIIAASVSAKSHHINNDYSGFEGMTIEGRPSVVTVRGKVQVRDGKFVGERGRGRMLKREPSHF